VIPPTGNLMMIFRVKPGDRPRPPRISRPAGRRAAGPGAPDFV